jgi:hypothetical protein
MKIKLIGQILLVVAVLAVHPASLPANETRNVNDQKSNETTVGRFMIIVVPATVTSSSISERELYRIDTVTGKTWRMTRVAAAGDNGQSTEEFFEGWIEISENPGQSALEWAAQKRESSSRPASDMKKEPNQALEPTSTAVTPPASAGDRASGARGSP